MWEWFLWTYATGYRYNKAALPPDRDKRCPYVISFQRMERKIMQTWAMPVPTLNCFEEKIKS
jgi:hypothetical protein